MKKLSMILVLVFMGAIAFPLQATVNLYIGNVDYSTDGKNWQPVQIGQELPENSIIRVNDPDGMVELALSDGSSIKLWSRTLFKISSLSESRNFELQNGDFSAKVAKTGSDFIVQTPVAVAAVRGTEFSVTVGENEGEVNVECGVLEGKVQVKHKESGEEVQVEAGNMVRVRKRARIMMQKMTQKQMKKFQGWKNVIKIAMKMGKEIKATQQGVKQLKELGKQFGIEFKEKGKEIGKQIKKETKEAQKKIKKQLKNRRKFIRKNMKKIRRVMNSVRKHLRREISRKIRIKARSAKEIKEVLKQLIDKQNSGSTVTEKDIENAMEELQKNYDSGKGNWNW